MAAINSLRALKGVAAPEELKKRGWVHYFPPTSAGGRGV